MKLTINTKIFDYPWGVPFLKSILLLKDEDGDLFTGINPNDKAYPFLWSRGDGVNNTEEITFDLSELEEGIDWSPLHNSPIVEAFIDSDYEEQVGRKNKYWKVLDINSFGDALRYGYKMRLRKDFLSSQSCFELVGSR